MLVKSALNEAAKAGTLPTWGGLLRVHEHQPDDPHAQGQDRNRNPAA